MISQGSGYFVHAPREGAYLSQNQRFWVRPFHPRNPGGYTPKSIGMWPRLEAIALACDPPDVGPVGQAPDLASLEVIPALRCGVCGVHGLAETVFTRGGAPRCAKHRGRNACAIEGCERSSAIATGEFLCGDHWRAGCPPHSEVRRIWNRAVRIVRRYGMTPDRAVRLDRLWAWIKRRAQSKANGDLDQREIDRMFGWAD